MRRSIVSFLVGAGLVSGAVLGCGGPQSDDQAVIVTRSALTTATDVFGFEDPSAWSTTTTGAVLTRSTTHSQGSFSLQVKPSSSNGFTPIASVPLSTLAGVSPTLAWDVMLPTQQPNPNNHGTVQMYLNCPSRNLFSHFLGQVSLTGKPLNVWNTVSFPLTNAEVTGLLQAGYTDLTITVVLNVQVPTTGLYFIDNLRFIPLANNACGGWPNGTSCTDNNACTQADTCQAGACRAGTPVTCTAQDQCHTAGTCNTSTGVCSNPAKANGATCNDGNACTQTDACQTGVCKGSNPIACPSLNQCNAGVCDPASGTCSTPPVANGTACNDGNACTSGDTCQSGVCGGSNDSLCGVSIRFEEIAALANGARTAIFSYTNPGKSTVSAPYGASNFISVNGVKVATPAQPVPTSFTPGDHPGALSYPLSAAATTVAWTLGPHVATASGAAKPLGTTSTGTPAVTVTNAAGNPILVAFDSTNADVSTAVIFSVTPSAINVPQGGSAAVTLNVEYVGPNADAFSTFSFVESEASPGVPSGLHDQLLPVGTQTPTSAYNWVFQADPTALLGQTNIFLTVGNPIPGGPSVSLSATVVSPAVATVNLANLSMKAPLTMQGVQSWSDFANIEADRPGDAVIEPFANYTSTPLPPFLSDANAPRWVKGNGFSVQDNLGLGAGVTGVPKVVVGTSQVKFQVNLSLVDDTSALAMTANAIADDFRDPINVNTGHLSCTTSLFPSVVEGNHGKYTVRMETWQDGATNCQPTELLDSDYPLDGVTFDGPSPDGATGCWVPINAPASKDLYSSQPSPDLSGAGINGPTAPQDGTLSTVMSIPVDLPGVATYLRYVVKLEEADTRVPTDTDIVGWDTTRRYPDAFSCQEEFSNGGQFAPFSPLQTPTTGQGYACPIGFDPNNYLWDAIVPFCPPTVPIVALPGENQNEGPLAIWRFRRPLVTGRPQQQTFVYEQASNPFQVVVEPVAIAQMKVLPLTILYQPPGDKSTAQYTLSQSFGTNMTASNLVSQNQSTAVNSKVTDGSTFSYKSVTSAGGGSSSGGGSSPPPDPVEQLFKSAGFSISGSSSDSSTWDNTTNVGSGRSTQAAVSNTATFQAIKTSTLGPDKSLVPGAAGTYAQEPFWDDTFVTIVHPQVGVWQANQGSSVILLGADGTPSSPALFFVTVRQLDQCAHQADPFPNGISINTSTHTPADSTDVLDANDCQQLLKLDPFYGVGQSLPTAPSTRVVVPQNAVTSTNYGTVGTESLTQKLDNILTYANVSTATNVATYNATVTDAFTTSHSDSLTLAAWGFTLAENDSQTGTTTNVNGWTVTFQSSFAATVQSSIGVEGVLSDDHAAAQFPAVFMFQDTAFGGFMFQDRAAPPPP